MTLQTDHALNIVKQKLPHIYNSFPKIRFSCMELIMKVYPMLPRNLHRQTKIKYNPIFQVTFISNYFISKSFLLRLKGLFGVDTPFRNKIFEKV